MPPLVYVLIQLACLQTSKAIEQNSSWVKSLFVDMSPVPTSNTIWSSAQHSSKLFNNWLPLSSLLLPSVQDICEGFEKCPKRHPQIWKIWMLPVQGSLWPWETVSLYSKRDIQTCPENLLVYMHAIGWRFTTRSEILQWPSRRNWNPIPPSVTDKSYHQSVRWHISSDSKNLLTLGTRS